MANNLLDIISGGGGTQPKQTDETQQLQQLLRAKSGRDVSGGAIGSSSLGEQQANVQTAQQMQPVLQSAQLGQTQQQQQGAQIAQQQAAEVQQLGQVRRANDLENRVKTEALLRDLERDKGKVDVDRDAARLEQVGTQLRMQSQQYVDNLQREGQKARLDNEIQFKEQLTKDTFGEMENLFRDQLRGKSVLDLSERQWAEVLNGMKISDAWNTYREEAKADLEKSKWENLGKLYGG